MLVHAQGFTHQRLPRNMRTVMSFQPIDDRPLSRSTRDLKNSNMHTSTTGLSVSECGTKDTGEINKKVFIKTQRVKRIEEESENSLFFGFNPKNEVVNGRIAMTAFSVLLYNEITSGQTFWQQFLNSETCIVGGMVAISLVGIVTMKKN